MAANSISLPITGTLAYLVDDSKYVRSTKMGLVLGHSINDAYMLAAIPSFTFTNLTV